MESNMRGLPRAQGMYSPEFEHDACGIGFVVNIHGKKSHKIVRQGLTILANLAHRGGAGSEENTGDGAGILLQIPDRFFRQVCPLIDITLPAAGEYGVGMLFLPRQADAREACQKRIEDIIRSEGQSILGWRTLPVNESTLGSVARANRPHFSQIFIQKSADCKTELDFERKLYVIRKRCESLTANLADDDTSYFYFASLSCRTIVFKGMLTADQIDAFYLDLTSLEFDSAMALVHSRYSTNTFPSWERAHPYRYLIHNGEINTLRGNINSMHARQANIKTDVFGEDVTKVFPIINTEGSDSAMFDNCLEFLTLSGRSLAHSAMMMVPEPWSKHESMNDDLKAFYEYHSMLVEPWDGPAAMAFTDGRQICAILDRNGLRPSRYYVTKDGLVILSSEAGVLDIPPEDIIAKNRLRPGRLLLIDTVEGRIVTDEEIKETVAGKHPYRKWINKYTLSLEHLPVKKDMPEPPVVAPSKIELYQKAFGYTYEDVKTMILPMAKDGIDPLGSMGQDTPLAVLSDKPQLLYNYFKQLFAQVTNPPIDSLRENIVTMSRLYLGSTGNLVDPKPEDCHQIKINHPILTDEDLIKLKNIDEAGFRSVTIPILFPAGGDGLALKNALSDLFAAAERAVDAGANILVLSDRGINKNKAAIPALLAVSGLHQFLTRKRKRKFCSLILESAEPREVHHFALLIGFGVSAINPYLAYATVEDLVRSGMLTGMTLKEANAHYVKASVKGIVKVLSKMGISAIQSYKGAQIFEALGIGKNVIDTYFTSTPSPIGGIGLDEIARESNMRHEAAYAPGDPDSGLTSGGQYQWRKDGEYHQFNPMTVHLLQQSVRNGDYGVFKEYSNHLNKETQRLCTIRGLLEFMPTKQPISIYEVEPVESIVRRFKTGAMSYGSISKEAHEALAIAMNRLGGKSNTGEGGEDPARFIPLPNGDSKNSAIKQVASGRFGVTSDYLVHARELQIKMAQGAKPGEGGQLPGRKVYPWIAQTRHSTPGVGLISPPPHHDIYSIEDLAELIHDLKNANKFARINVKLVSEIGVGTIAAGVAKGRADVVLISGYDGGTGASPKTSIRHAGLPWELGLAETHQTLLLNDLRSRIIVETDGKLLTGRDVAIAALLGAEEFGFATGPLVALGCVMMRVCNLDTCPVGVATQNPELRRKFCGKPEYVVNFMRFIAEELREVMAELGFKTVDEMIGRTDMLRADNAVDFWKARGLDLSCLLYQPNLDSSIERHCTKTQDHKLEETLDQQILIPLCQSALEQGKPVRVSLPVRNVNRVVGTQLGSEVTRKYGAKGLPDNTIDVLFKGSAGQSFGAFIPSGITLRLEGDSNDYVGKGLSGGRIAVFPDAASTFVPQDNIIIGNVAFYGATSGEAYINGVAGERFCVRNSGASAVVEGCGDHGCEYMTGGQVIVLGQTGRNFAAGMSGGIAYVYDEDGKFATRCNREMVGLSTLSETDDITLVKLLILKHVEYTGSKYAAGILEDFDKFVPKFVKVFPKDYERMLNAIKEVEAQGLSGEAALLAAFEVNSH
ncbi:MAG: glutamate synthase large subunit [Eubacteriales bacterium]